MYVWKHVWGKNEMHYLWFAQKNWLVCHSINLYMKNVYLPQLFPLWYPWNSKCLCNSSTFMVGKNQSGAKKKKKKRKKCFPVIFFFLSFLLNPHVFPNSLVSQLISNQRNKWIMLFLLSFCFGCVTFNRCNWRVEQPFFKVSMSFIMVKLCCLLYVLGVWVVSKLFWQIFLSLHYTKVYPYPFWNLWCCALLLWHG